MKNYFILLLICPLNCLAQFNSKSDTIIISTKKQIDSRTYLNRVLNIPESTNNCQELVFPKLTIIPSTLDSVSIFIDAVDFGQAFYQSLRAGLINDKEFIDASKDIVDTTKCHEKYINTYISVLTGIGKDSILYYVPETNNNFDFSDEKVYTLNRFHVPNQQKKLHKIIYERFSNGRVVLDSTFITISYGLHDNLISKNKTSYKKLNEIQIHVNESRYAAFRYNKINYNFIITPGVGASYENKARLYFYTKNLDFSSLELPYNKVGDYIKLGTTSYLISDIVDNGDKVILVKEKNLNGRSQ